MPRMSKKRGKGHTYRGISNHKVCIYSGVDENDNCIFKIEGVGSETKAKTIDFMHSFTPNQGKKNYLITDMKQVYRELVNYTNLSHIEIKSNTYVSEEGYSLSSINQLHNEFQQLYGHYRGVSIRHLQGYLNFFSFYKRMNYTIETMIKREQEVYREVMKEEAYLPQNKVCRLAIPIDLYSAYGDWHYGCFSEPLPILTT